MAYERRTTVRQIGNRVNGSVEVFRRIYTGKLLSTRISELFLGVTTVIALEKVPTY